MNEKPQGRPTHLDLCSGIGGFSLAFERAGFETIGFAEIDQACSEHLKKKWPAVQNHGDVTKLPVITCNVVTAGDPCQPFSIGGKQRGEADNRYLWPSVLNALERSKADFFVGENVVGVANLVLSRRIDELEARGYQSFALDLPSCCVGLPSVERHVWLVAASESFRFQNASERQNEDREKLWQLLGSDTGKGNGRIFPKPRTLRSGKGLSKRVHALGNAAPPPIIEVIARAIRSFY